MCRLTHHNTYQAPLRRGAERPTINKVGFRNGGVNMIYYREMIKLAQKYVDRTWKVILGRDVVVKELIFKADEYWPEIVTEEGAILGWCDFEQDMKEATNDSLSKH